MEEERAKPVCAQEALDLLNCVAQSPYDQEKCVLLLQALRECVLNKKVKKFSLADQDQQEGNPVVKEA
ncbi:hypothetical protein MANES_01G046100v8 [Manihot esculenta]|uniref:CHCH domain-containing protein n=1 Tax=Manihot esculenta TaxID=3983 RepID=A0A2C9WJ58_MANES|nr:hypothetical protein MANES_01G046100v8 [Manihot esculenta]